MLKKHEIIKMTSKKWGCIKKIHTLAENFEFINF